MALSSLCRAISSPSHPRRLDSRDILPILRFGENSWDAGSTSETYRPETLPDRRSLGIESETTQTGIDCGTPRVALCLREARGRGRGQRIRPIPASSVACATCWKRHIACKLRTKNISFSETISETRFSHSRWPHASRPCRRDDCSRHVRKRARNVIEPVTRICVPSAAGSSRIQDGTGGHRTNWRTTPCAGRCIKARDGAAR